MNTWGNTQDQGRTSPTVRISLTRLKQGDESEGAVVEEELDVERV